MLVTPGSQKFKLEDCYFITLSTLCYACLQSVVCLFYLFPLRQKLLQVNQKQHSLI